jgi:putative resolvase
VNLTEWAHARGIHVTTAYRWYREGTLPVVRAGAGVGSGMNGSRPEVRRLLAGPGVSVVVAGRRDRLGRVNTELAEAALAAHRRGLVVLDGGLVVLDESEVTGDLVRDMTGVLTSFCARRYGGRPARNRALKAVGCAQRDIGPQAVLAAGSTPRGGAG